MLRREEMHHTYEQAFGIIASAEQLVADAEVDEDLRPVAFAKAVDLLAAKQIFFDQASAIPLGVTLPGNGGR